MPRSYLEDVFAAWLEEVNAPPFERQYRFDPDSKRTADFAWPDERVIVEVQGLRGKHLLAAGYIKDCQKHMDALRLGWVVFPVPGAWIARQREDGTVYYIRKPEVMRALAEIINLRRQFKWDRWREPKE